MDQNEFHDGGDSADQFHRNEAISAVADEVFLGEDDDDYEDLYNSVRKKLNVTAGEPRVELGQSSAKIDDMANNNRIQNLGFRPLQHHQVATGNFGSLGNAGGGNVSGSSGSFCGSGGGGTVLCVGDLDWWTTDADLESELCKYGHVKEVKFVDEKNNGKSKGYCKVEFYDSLAAAACKNGMNGHVFNGRPCVVTHASAFSVKTMGEAKVKKKQQMAPYHVVLGKTGGNNMRACGNFQGGGTDNRGYGRGNWGRGNSQGMVGMQWNGGNGIGPPPVMHTQLMMGQGFDPCFGGRMGSYVGFPRAPTPPFSGMLPSVQPVSNVGLPGLDHAFFVRGMPINGTGNGVNGMSTGGGINGTKLGMWSSDPNMAGWAGDERGGRVGEEAASGQQYGERSHDRDGEAGYESDLLYSLVANFRNQTLC